MQSSAIMPTYFNQLPINIEKGKGVWLWDTEKNKYLDALAGIAVCSLGHCHPAIVATMIQQAKKLVHCSNTYLTIQAEKLAVKLTQLAKMEQAYFCNSGAEANEAAIKLTRMYARKKEIKEPVIIVMKNAFHGCTMATLSASTERVQVGFEPILSGYKTVTLNDVEELRRVSGEDKNVIAIMLEPIQGDGGIKVATGEYLKAARELCDKNDWLLIFDEVQCGIGRTGKWFAHQYFDVIPDVMTCAKALGNGVPIAACLARGKACNLFLLGGAKHGSTFGGNPFACTVALTVLETLEKENCLQNAAEMGEYLRSELQRTLKGKMVEIRGKGLMIGIELPQNCLSILPIGLKHKLLFNVVANNVIRLLPALIINQKQADQIVRRLTATVKEFLKNNAS